MNVFSSQYFAENFNRVKEKIANAAFKVGRNPNDIRLMAVTKSFPLSYVDIALKGGIHLFGENRVHEAADKFSNLNADFELHLIGHLQRNKAKLASQTFACVQSIDKIDTVVCLDSFCNAMGKKMDILIEVNSSCESSKSGVRSREEAFVLLDKILSLEYIRPRGLMCVGPFVQVEKEIHTSFSFVRELFFQCKTLCAEPFFDSLSMGMSSDFEIAIEEGSNLVRIGTALFGPR